MPNTYFNIATNGDTADIDIYGNITEFDRWDDKSMASYTLVKKLEEMKDVKNINVRINSRGGDVREGVAIYNALRSHPAKVTTRCDGWACSIASVIFMAGDERIMYETSLLWIHNAVTWAGGNANDFRKQADDLDVITDSIKTAYLQHVSIDAGKLTEMMDAETFITPQEAIDWGFATSVADKPAEGGVQASADDAIFRLLTAPRQTIDAAAIADMVVMRLTALNAADPAPASSPEPGEDPEPEPKPEPAENNMAANLAAFFMAKN